MLLILIDYTFFSYPYLHALSIPLMESVNGYQFHIRACKFCEWILRKISKKKAEPRLRFHLFWYMERNPGSNQISLKGIFHS